MIQEHQHGIKNKKMAISKDFTTNYGEVKNYWVLSPDWSGNTPSGDIMLTMRLYASREAEHADMVSYESRYVKISLVDWITAFLKDKNSDMTKVSYNLIKQQPGWTSADGCSDILEEGQTA
jgi:hypothetical protein